MRCRQGVSWQSGAARAWQALLLKQILPLPLQPHHNRIREAGRHCTDVRVCFCHLCPCRMCGALVLQAFLGVIDMCRSDMYLHPHTRYYMRELRLMAYNQVRASSVFVVWKQTKCPCVLAAQCDCCAPTLPQC